MEQLAEKEGKKGNKQTIEIYMGMYGRDSRILTFRILDELLIKESRSN